MGRTMFTTSASGFFADPASIVRSNGGRQIDWANVPSSYASLTPGNAPVTAVVGAAGAALGATSVPVAALTSAIPSGTVIDFGGAKFARLTAIAAAGATALTVTALVTALVSGDTATYAGTTGSGKKRLPAGTAVGDLLGTGKISPRIATTNPAIGLLETDAAEDDPSQASSGVGVIIGGSVFEALLPGTSGSPRVLPTAVKTELQSAGTGFAFQVYSDVR